MHHSMLIYRAGMLQVIVILAGTNNHDHTASQIVGGLLEIVKTCQEKQPQADILVMVHANLRYLVVRPLLIIGVERDYLRGTICLVPSLTAVLYTSAVHMCTCVLSLCGREVV